jgi:uncharacterized membrane protein
LKFIFRRIKIYFLKFKKPTLPLPLSPQTSLASFLRALKQCTCWLTIRRQAIQNHSNMKKYACVALLGLLLPLGACQGGSDSAAANQDAGLPPVATFKGQIQYGAGKFAFFDCASGKVYAISDSTMSLGRLYQKACQPAACPGESAMITAQGRLFTKADPGMGEEHGILAVVGIDSLYTRTMDNACVPFNYWCHGTEPFWSLVVSKREGGFFFKELASEKGRYYTWSPFTLTEHNTTTFVVHEYRNSDAKMTVYIRPERSNDGMSDQEYNYSATIVTPDGRTLRGVAVAWDERSKF